MAAPAPQRKRRILVCGDVAGNFARLCARLSELNASKGPFDLCFCVGRFFSPQSTVEELQQLEVAVPVYFHEAIDAPAALGRQMDFDEADEAALPEVAGNIRYLGRAGLCVLDGFTVAFVAQSVSNSDVERIKAKTSGSYKGADVLLTSVWPGGVLHGVPEAGLQTLRENGISSAGVDAEINADRFASLARCIRPRYHFAGNAGVFYSRPPYRSAGVSEPGSIRVTRFIGLGPVSDDASKVRKWLHAVAVAPFVYASEEELSKEPKGCTGSPYEETLISGVRPNFDPRLAANQFAEDTNNRMPVQRDAMVRGKRRLPSQSGERDSDNNTLVYVGNLGVNHGLAEAALRGFFAPVGNVVRVQLPEGKPFGFVEFETPAQAQMCVASMNNSSLGRFTLKLGFGKRRNDTGGPDKRQKTGPKYPKDPRVKCWFCLANPELEAHLIAHIGEEVYIASPKGALVPDHCLVVPIEHIPSLLHLSPSVHAEMKRFKDAISRLYLQKQCYPLIWERCVSTRGTHHMHLQVLPIPESVLSKSVAVLQDCADYHGGADFEEIRFSPDATSLRQALQDGDEYLYIEVPRQKGMPICLLHRFPEGRKRLPMHFGRIFAAELLRQRGRAHWKSCVVSQEAEEGVTNAFRDSLAPHLEG